MVTPTYPTEDVSTVAAQGASWHLLAWPAEDKVVAAGVRFGPGSPPPAGGSPSTVSGRKGDDYDGMLYQVEVVLDIVLVIVVMRRWLAAREGDAGTVRAWSRFAVV